MPNNSDEQEKKQTLVELAKNAIQRDNALREKYQIGDKFRFVRDRLHALLEQLEKHVNAMIEEKKSELQLGEDEALAYVYLYNSQGTLLPTWLNMVTPRLFYEYSVNRPIYSEKSHIELLIRSKANKLQHAYLTIAVKQNDFLRGEESAKDSLGNPTIKVREGALHFDKLMAFTHNDQDYTLVDGREFVKKNPA